jgi:cell division septation protein DedD
MSESRKIVASPMMADDQRQVLDLMAATNSVVLQLKRQVDDDGKKIREMQAQLDDMKGMVSLSQARLLSGATQIAMGNMQPAPEAQPTAQRQPVAAETPDMSPACRLRPSYMVASASPAHATLKNGGQVFISVRAPSRDNPQGDSIPCYGHVLKITQEGSRWVVMTERDVIGRN